MRCMRYPLISDHADAAALARRIHDTREYLKESNRVGYAITPWDNAGIEYREETIDLAGAIMDGQTIFAGRPIPEWALNLNDH